MQRYLAILLTSAIVACHAVPWNTAAAQGRKCFTTFPEQRVTGRLDPGGSVLVRQWDSRCVGLFTASSGAGRTVLQVKSGGEWIDIATGAFIHKPQLGPGSYRLVLQNISAAVGTITYTVRYRISGG